MKRITLFLLLLTLLSSCGDNKTKTDDINYSNGKVIDIVLLEEFNLNATSDHPLTYHSDNELIVTVSQDGVIKGKNVGEANVTISNSINEITVQVVVSLFEEPTLNFYISQEEIRKIYGAPDYTASSEDSTVYIYGSGADWYSYAVWEMDFFFIDNQYIEADLYIRKELQQRIDEFMNSNYFIADTITDTIDNEFKPVYLYLNSDNIEEANVCVGKIYDEGPYDDICLFYIPFDYEDDKRIVGDRIRRIRDRYYIKD